MLAKYYDKVGANIAPTIRKIKFDANSPEGRDASAEGAFCVTCRLVLEVSVPRRLGASGVVIRIAHDGYESEDIAFELCGESLTDDVYSVSLALADLCAEDDSGLFYYELLFLRGAATLFTDSINNIDFRLYEHSSRLFRLLVYSADFTVPTWFGKGLMYHIFVDRFCSTRKFPLRDGSAANNEWHGGITQYAEAPGGEVANNEFFGGDLDGVAEKLDYLESLGVSTIYLSPIFDSPSNHKYDTSDYMRVDPMFGGDGALENLIRETDRRGMRIILDGVFNHTGDDSLYFDRYGKHGSNGAYCSTESPYFDWYNFKSYPDEYECWWNIPIMPRLKQERLNCRQFFTSSDGVCAEYVKRGVHGWRLDVADELCDEFLDELRQSVKQASSGEAIIIGEVWENAADKRAYGKRRRYFQGKQLDSVMNYPLKNGIIDFVLLGDGELLYNILTEIYSSYPRAVCDSLMNIIGTHDTERILTVLSGADTGAMTNAELACFRLSEHQREVALRRLKLASVIQYTVYGTPSLYYGDEAGVEGGRDPFCRLPFPWGREDAELLEHYRRLGSIRSGQNVYNGGDFRILEWGNGSFVFERSKDGERIVTLVNSGEGTYTFKTSQKHKDLLTGEIYCGNVMLQPCTAAVLKLQGE